MEYIRGGGGVGDVVGSRCGRGVVAEWRVVSRV